MSLRTRLIIAFLLLSVVPLSAVTFFTYRSWVATFEAAAQREAAQSAADIGRRMERITADIGRRMDRLFVAPAADAEGSRGASSVSVRERIPPLLGETAPLVERVEFHPAPGRPDAPAPPADPARPAAPGLDAPQRGRGEEEPRGRMGRGRGGRFGWPPRDPPGNAAAPEVIVVDVQEAIESARRVAEQELANIAPELSPLLEEGGSSAPPAAETLDPSEAASDRPAMTGAPGGEVDVQVEGRRVRVAVRQDGRVVGTANATLNLDRTLGTVFAFSRRDQGEIPFAIDTRGGLHNPNPEDLKLLESFGAAALAPASARDGRPRRAGDWLIVARRDPSGLIFGIARPIGESLREIRRASVRNLSLGLAAIALALVGIVPISHRMTRHLASLDAGVRQLAAGDFRTRVQVRSRDEFGSLAAAFNQMAEDLERHQALVIEQERLRRELELARLIQTEMLPKGPLHLGPFVIVGMSMPAREVGGDFFNYFPLGQDRLALLVGDVSGKGVSAALLMANVQATLRARVAPDVPLAGLAADLDRDIDASTPGAMYLTLFLAVLDTRRRQLRYVNAGHNPPFLVRSDGGVETMAATGLPIALYPGQPYTEAVVDVNDGDELFLYTDGIVETENEAGEPYGMERLQALVAATRASGSMLEQVESAVREFRGAAEPLDDATLIVLRPSTSPLRS